MRTPKQRGKAKLRSDRTTATNVIWPMDFAHDQHFAGKKIRALTVDDTLHPAITGDRYPEQLSRKRCRRNA